MNPVAQFILTLSSMDLVGSMFMPSWSQKLWVIWKLWQKEKVKHLLNEIVERKYHIIRNTAKFQSYRRKT